MQNKLQELTDKIYQEGVLKGNTEAQLILDNAQKEAIEIIAKAHKEADLIIEKANKKASELEKNSASEIKLSGRQALNSIKQQITNLLNDLVISDTVSPVVKYAGFIKSTIETIVANWSKADLQMSNLQILLSDENNIELITFFKQALKSRLDQGLEIKTDSNVANGFKISPKDGSYTISFTEADFEAFFKQYLRPQITSILYNE